MGCKNTKIVPISDITTSSKLLSSSPIFDELPVEVIYKILDELDISTIFISLYNVCHRFNEILSTYNQYHLNLNYFHKEIHQYQYFQL